MYFEDDELNKVAEEVIEQFGDELPDVYGQPCRIKYLMKDSKKSQYLGKCSRATGKWGYLVGMDYVIEIWFSFWKEADEAGKRALLFHELRHVKLEEKETEEGDIEINWKIRKHYAEIFPEEITLFGAWRPELETLISVCKEV